MNNNLIKHIFLLPIIINSCNHFYYQPNMHNVPQFTKKHQVVINGNNQNKKNEDEKINEANKNNQLQIAASVTNNIAVQFNSFKQTNIWNSSVWGGPFFLEHSKLNMKDAAVGYYKTLANKKGKSLLADAYFGYGKGSVDNRYEYNWAIMDFEKYYFQTSIGFKHKIFEIALSTKFNQLKYYNIRARLYRGEEGALEAAYIHDNPNPLLFEYALTYKLGYKFAWLSYQTGNSTILKNKGFYYANHWSNFSLQLRLSKETLLFKRKK